MSHEPQLAALLDTTTEAVTSILTQTQWAEDEIATAQQRHPHATDTLHHSCTLLRPTHEWMHTEFVSAGVEVGHGR